MPSACPGRLDESGPSLRSDPTLQQPQPTPDIRQRLGDSKPGHRIAVEEMSFSWRWVGGIFSRYLGLLQNLELVYFLVTFIGR